MNVHKNAKLAPAGRALLVERVVLSRERRAAVAAAFGVSARPVGKWVVRWQHEGPAGLVDRSSRPRRSPRQVAPRLVRRVERLRRLQPDHQGRERRWQLSDELRQGRRG